MPELGLMLPILGIRSCQPACPYGCNLQAWHYPDQNHAEPRLRCTAQNATYLLCVGKDASLDGFVFARGGHRFIYRKSLLRLIDGLLQDI